MAERISEQASGAERYEPGDYRIEVSVESAREGIEKSLPDFEVKDIELFNEGLGGAIFRVNGEYLFKFAKHEKASRAIESEIIFLPKVREYATLPIPEVAYVGSYGEKGLRFFGYPEIKGVGLKREHMVGERGHIEETFVKQIADFVEGIQSCKVDEARRWGVKEVNPKDFYLKQLEDTREVVYPFLDREFPGEAASLKTFIEGAFEGYFSDALNFTFEPKLLHGDLEGEQAILYGPEENKIAGVVDFGGLQINDPDFELWRLFAHYGRDFMEVFLRYNPNGDPERLYKKLDFFWDAQTVHRLVRQLMLGDAENIEWNMDKLRERANRYTATL